MALIGTGLAKSDKILCSSVWIGVAKCAVLHLLSHPSADPLFAEVDAALKKNPSQFRRATGFACYHAVQGNDLRVQDRGHQRIAKGTQSLFRFAYFRQFDSQCLSIAVNQIVDDGGEQILLVAKIAP